MKLLAPYDIHGNPDALEAVLSDPRAQGADVIVVGGDVVPGALAQQTLDRLDRLATVVWVRGNGEREVAAASSAASGSSQPGSGFRQTANRMVNGVRFINAGSVGLRMRVTATLVGCGSKTVFLSRDSQRMTMSPRG
jgi:predicted phosphodiesterase